jgi:predicted unusual protein kinase regulating ubiquinone biosynthesis (AarF/ABC1/UbiB family)
VLRARYRRIVFFFARVILGLAVWELVLPRVGLAGLAARTRSERLRRSAVRFRQLAIALGGVLIKVGQFLSARLDLLPDEITAELAGLQDEVPPERFEAIRVVAESELGVPLAARFGAFEEAPLAAASLGQVHRAELPAASADGAAATGGGPSGAASGEPVVVKVQRPDMERLIATDLAALRTIGRWLQAYPPIRRRADVPALLAEFTEILNAEIDYLGEGRNAEIFAANFEHDPAVRVPRVVWSHTTRRVLTLENVQAIKITDYAAISAAGIDRAEVAARLFDTYLQQIFRDGFFHADPHPGNLFVAPGADGADWRLTFVDFGMTGRLSPALRAGLREAAIAVGTRDSARLVRAYQTLGALRPQADLALLERAQNQLFARFWGKNMTELRALGPRELRALVSEFRELLYTLPFQVPQDMILLGRTVGILSGICTGLDPDFNVWDHLAPFAQELLAADASGRWGFALDELGTLAGALLALPQRLERTLARLDAGELTMRAPQLDEQLGYLDQGLRRLGASVIFAALLLAGVQLLLAGQSTLAALLLAGSALALGSALFAGGSRR